MEKTSLLKRTGRFMLLLLLLASLSFFVLLMTSRSVLRPINYVGAQTFTESEAYSQIVGEMIFNLMQALEPDQQIFEGLPQDDYTSQMAIGPDGHYPASGGTTVVAANEIYADAIPSSAEVFAFAQPEKDEPDSGFAFPSTILFDRAFSADSPLQRTSLSYWYWSKRADEAPLSNKIGGMLSKEDVIEKFDHVFDFAQTAVLKGNGIPAYWFIDNAENQFHGLLAYSIDWSKSENKFLLSMQQSYQIYSSYRNVINWGLFISGLLALLLSAYFIRLQLRKAPLPAAVRASLSAPGKTDRSDEVPSLIWHRIPVDVLLLILLAATFAFILAWLFYTGAYRAVSLNDAQLARLTGTPLQIFWQILILPLDFLSKRFVLLPLPIIALLVSLLLLARRYSAGTLQGPWLIQALARICTAIIRGLFGVVQKIVRGCKKLLASFFGLLMENSSRSKLIRRSSSYFAVLLVLIALMYWTTRYFYDPRPIFLAILLLASVPILLFTLHQWRSLEQLETLNRHLQHFRNGIFDIPEPPVNCPKELRKLSLQLRDISSIISDAVAERSKSERLKSELITNVSHDLRTPLTSIINYIDLLKQEPVSSEKAAEYLQILEAKSTRLRLLTENLIEASKAMSGNLSLSAEEIELPELLRQEAGEYSKRMQDRQLDLILRLPDAQSDEQSRIVTDPRHLSRILDNLLNNAAKYALPGSRVYLSLQGENNIFNIELKNIAEHPPVQNADELFERFTRGDAARTSTNEGAAHHTGAGSGLGLAIAKSLSELLGGRLKITIDDDVFLVSLCLPRTLDTNPDTALSNVGPDANPGPDEYFSATQSPTLASLTAGGFDWFNSFKKSLQPGRSAEEILPFELRSDAELTPPSEPPSSRESLNGSNMEEAAAAD